MKTALAIALLCVPFAATAQATSTTVAVDATTPTSDTAKPRIAKQDPQDVDRLCLRETGTRIRPSRSAGARCPNAQPGRVYTQDDLRNTGRVDLADMLRTLDPSIH